jgi:hypothetical protein
MSRAPAMAATRPIGPLSTTDYFLCGWRVRSAVPVSEARLWAGDGRTPDVHIRLGSAPALVDPVLQGKGPVQVGRDGTCRLGIERVGRFLVIGGHQVIVEPCGDVETPEFQGWLLGAVVGMLCHQRGLFPLHAASVRIAGGAVALTGRPGSGKSTLAAALVRRGHDLLADDVCVVDAQAPDGPIVMPSFPRLKLQEDSLLALDIPAEGVPRSGSGKRKFHFGVRAAFDPQPAPLRAIYYLDRSDPERAPDIRPQSGANAIAILTNEIYRRPIGFHLGRKLALLAEVLRIAAAAPVFRQLIRADLSELGATATQIEAHLAASTRGQNNLPEKSRST